MSFLKGDMESGLLSDDILSPRIAAGEIILGVIDGINSEGSPVVKFSTGGELVSYVAQTTTSITAHHQGRQVALLFANGDMQKPIVVGLIFSPLEQLLDNYSEQQVDSCDSSGAASVSGDQVVFDSPLPRSEKGVDVKDAVQVDGKRVVIEGQDEVVLRCGEASITLTKAGKIMIRGKYLLNRSSGVNRILGGSVQVN